MSRGWMLWGLIWTKIWWNSIWWFACPTANLPNLILYQTFWPYGILYHSCIIVTNVPCELNVTEHATLLKQQPEQKNMNWVSLE